MDATDRLALPFIIPGQAQKELFHNEALQILDALVGAAVEEPPRSMPPATPIVGTCFLVAAQSEGEWSEQGGHLAAYTSGGWRYLAPVEGLSVFVKSLGTAATYRGGAWEVGVLHALNLVIAGQQVIGERQMAIANPTGGNQVDLQAREAITAILEAMRAHGLIDV